MGYNFTKNSYGTVKDIFGFSGLDYSAADSKTDDSFSPNAKNMYVTSDGVIKKRTGYKCVLENTTGERVNGIHVFEYRVNGENLKKIVIHIGTSLYWCTCENGEFTLGDLIYTGLLDKKSRSFMFGGALYLIGAGYFKLMWDENFSIFVYGRVSKAETDTENDALILEGRVKSSYEFNEPAKERMCADSAYKRISFANDTYSCTGKDRLYIVKSEMADKIKVAGVYLNDGEEYFAVNESDYEVATVDAGMYVIIKKSAGSALKDSYKCAPYVKIVYNNFVYTPTSITGRTPLDINGVGYPGSIPTDFQRYTGQVEEGFNLACPKRKIQFDFKNYDSRNGSAARFYLDALHNEGFVNKIMINGEIIQTYRVYQSSQETAKVRCNGCRYVDIDDSLLKGTDNIVEIEYTCTDAELEMPIDDCSIFSFYGGANDTRVFLSGNKKYCARDYASYLYEATFFSDQMYTDIGNDLSAIVGYHKISNYQVIIKDGKNNDSTQYLRKYSLGSDGVVYTISQGSGSYSASSISSFKEIGDVMLFAGEHGVFRLKSTEVENQTNVVCVSRKINKKLCKLDISKAVCTLYDEKYYLASEGKIYIYDPIVTGSWCLYDNIPEVISFFCYDGYLFFSSEDKNLYRFMLSEEKNAFYDNVAKDGNTNSASAIDAVWEIPTTFLDTRNARKDICQVNVFIIPHKRSGVSVYYNTEYEKMWKVHEQNADIFDFSDIDFERFTFNTQDTPMCISINEKAKDVNLFGVTLENDRAGENFEVCGVSIRYKKRKYIK